MDQGGILLVNLSKGEVGEGPASLIGSLLVASIGLAGLARANQASDLRRDFYVYLDEYHSFATLSLAGMLSELRKYRVSLVLAQQYLSQVETEIRDAVLGNVGTVIVFRVGPQDVGVLVRELAPEFDAEDILRLPNFRFYIRLLIDGAVSRPFSAETLEADFLSSLLD
jgi:DNA helicase HerA-like ATPase